MNWGTRFLYERYHLPIFITENGLSCNDHIFLDGKVHDAERIDFLTRYLLQLSESIKEGTPVMGYFHWSLRTILNGTAVTMNVSDWYILIIRHKNGFRKIPITGTGI